MRRNEDEGGRPRPGDSELSFRGIIHIVARQNERGGKLAGARNIAFSSASSKKEETAIYVAHPFATPFRTRSDGRTIFAAPGLHGSLDFCLSSVFARRFSLFEHLFPAGGRATRSSRPYTYTYRLRQHRDRAVREAVSSMQKGVDQRTQSDSPKLVYLNIGNWKLHELFQSLKVFPRRFFFLSLKCEVLIILMNVVVWKKI